MSRCNCKCGSGSCGGVIGSVLFGAGVTVLYVLGYLPNILTAVWIALGLGVLTLLLLAAGLLATDDRRSVAACTLATSAPRLLFSSVGTILLATAGTAMALAAMRISGIIVVAVGAFFFALLLLSLISWILCTVKWLCSGGTQ